jgi:hypothetical protein
VSYFPNGDDVIGRGVATATVMSDWNANVHIPGRLLRVDMTLVRAVNCSLQLEGLQALTDNQPARLSAFGSCQLRKLRRLSGGDHRADGHKAARPRCNFRAQLQVTEQHVGRVPHDTRDGRTELFLDECARCAAAVDRQRRHGDSGKLIGPNVAGGKDLDDRDR